MYKLYAERVQNETRACVCVWLMLKMWWCERSQRSLTGLWNGPQGVLWLQDFIAKNDEVILPLQIGVQTSKPSIFSARVIIYRWKLTYVYRTVHHLDSWIKIDQLDVTCFIISLFNAQHVSDVNPSAWSDGHCPHAARSHSFVYVSTS
jgi:hypothetical protein